MSPRPVCFVICPIGDPDTSTRRRSNLLLRTVVGPALKTCGFSPLRADQILEPGIITRQIVEQLIAAPLVIADLTGSNPNVFYELGVRHSVRKPVIHLAEMGTKIPFDVGGMRTFFYDLTNPSQIRKSLKELVESIRAIQSATVRAESPVSLAARTVLDGSQTSYNRELWQACERLVYDVPRTYLSREACYKQIPLTVAEVAENEPGPKQLWLAALHGHSGKRLTAQTIPETSEFDDSIRACILSEGPNRWEVCELVNVVSLDRLERVKARLLASADADGYELRAFCLPKQLPLISPLIIGSTNLFLGVEDPRYNRISAAIHIDRQDAVKGALSYLSTLWNHPKTFKLRTPVEVSIDAIDELEREIRGLPDCTDI